MSLVGIMSALCVVVVLALINCAANIVSFLFQLKQEVKPDDDLIAERKKLLEENNQLKVATILVTCVRNDLFVQVKTQFKHLYFNNKLTFLLCVHLVISFCHISTSCRPAVLNLWATAHWWAVDLCLVGRDKGWELRIF